MTNLPVDADRIRREKLFLILQEDPSLTNEQLARLLGVPVHSVLHDLQIISEDLRLTQQETHEIHKYRLLNEIRANKQECLSRLHQMSKPNQGARWIEEWGKLTEREMKILGIGQNSTLTIERGKSFDKRSRDAAIAAAIRAHESGACMLDALPPEPPCAPDAGEEARELIEQSICESSTAEHE